MHKTDFATHLIHDRRLVILRLLTELPMYRANSSVLTMALERFGHAITRDQVKTELSWLQEQALVKLEDLGPVLVASATERGMDVAIGRATVPGVARPGA
ncbi:ArsR family transcriptional regulator [Rhodoferax sp. U2-2l]|uniref:VpaChn25_0724 family phage protein n=1 Tax=Rhodoferax sp. U2-2l TaxID=2884000 RepID=UPI001D0A1A97|nr:ArsR family transcriptional regulator [Rhodoferax sp. U2-2l]MCB8748357.1 ArsR family transcriptional regulator [Rhodoferax sp. U2-2l]